MGVHSVHKTTRREGRAGILREVSPRGGTCGEDAPRDRHFTFELPMDVRWNARVLRVMTKSVCRSGMLVGARALPATRDVVRVEAALPPRGLLFVCDAVVVDGAIQILGSDDVGAWHAFIDRIERLTEEFRPARTP